MDRNVIFSRKEICSGKETMKKWYKLFRGKASIDSQRQMTLHY